MPGPIDLGHAVTLTPKDAIAYFEAKGHKITWDWWKHWQEANAAAFTVAKVGTTDLLQDISSGISRALREGTTERDFIKQLTPILQAKGWWGKQVKVHKDGTAEIYQAGSLHRLRTIYRTNTQSAYNAARYKVQMEIAAARPYWMYTAVMDSRTRPGHAALHGKVFRYDDPIWDSIYPPNGFNCRCRVRALSERNMKNYQLEAGSSEGHLDELLVDAGVDKETGEVIKKPVTVWRGQNSAGQDVVFRTDPGWNYNPGAAAYGKDIELMRKLTLVEDLAIRTQAVQALNNSELRQAVFAGWVENVLTAPRAGRRAGHVAETVGFMDEATSGFAVRVGSNAPTRVIVMPEKRLVHADNQKHVDGGIALTLDEYKALPKMIANPDAVYWDKLHKNIVYTADAGGGLVYYAPVAPGSAVRKHGPVDAIKNAYKIEASRLNDKGRYEKMP